MGNGSGRGKVRFMKADRPRASLIIAAIHSMVG
jgi:hypothetical protein